MTNKLMRICEYYFETINKSKVKMNLVLKDADLRGHVPLIDVLEHMASEKGLEI